MKRLIHGDSLIELDKLEENSIDSCVTDPPYNLSSTKDGKKGFMGKEWDNDIAFRAETWDKVYRVMKPGSYLLACGGTRTYHKMVTAIEMAGFQIRDCVTYLFGSGFPKSHNVGKSVDKLRGTVREVTGKIKAPGFAKKEVEMGKQNRSVYEFTKTEGQSEWEGWGTALKPMQELIVLARKPLDKGLTIAQNCLKHGTGGLNIHDCRVEHNEDLTTNPRPGKLDTQGMGWGFKRMPRDNKGRFPGNVILECICDKVIPGKQGEKTERSSVDNKKYYFGLNNKRITGYTDTGSIHTNPDCPCYMIDNQSGVSKGDSRKSKSTYDKGAWGNMPAIESTALYNDTGGASRFFYCPKPSKKEKNNGLDRNTHPTIKPISLMEYMITLCTPKCGTVLDPFMGSGTTAIAADNLDYNFVGIEKELEYFIIAEKRIEYYNRIKPIDIFKGE